MSAMYWTIAVRMWGWAAALRLLKRMVPLERLVRLMCPPSRASGRSPAFERTLEAYMSARRTFPFRAPANCLERSLGAYRLLCARNASPEVVIGVRHTSQRAVEGHVWVRVDGRALSESPADLQSYAVVVTFDAAGQQHQTGVSAGCLSGVPLT